MKIQTQRVITVRKLSIPFLFLLFASLTGAALAQIPDPAIKATQVFGKVTEINASAGQLTIKTAAGSVVVASLNEKTTYQRMPPGETDRTKAEQTSLTEITVGDGVVARGYVANDRKSLPAQQIIVVSQSEIAKKNASERQAWARGAKGIVTSLNPSTKEVTVTSRSLGGASQVISVALPDKATGQVKINDLQTKKPLTIILKPDSVLRRLPPNIAMMFSGGPGGPGGPGQGGGPRPQGQGQPAQGAEGQRPQSAGPGGNGPRMGGGGSMADMMERFPTISISDLKVGDTILLSSLPGADPTQLTAIQIVSGVEPLLTMMAGRQQQGGQGRPQGVDLNGSFGGMFGGVGVP